jgi:hypothetical protein
VVVGARSATGNDGGANSNAAAAGSTASTATGQTGQSANSGRK